MKLDQLLQRAHFVPDEIKLSQAVEKVIFQYNMAVRHSEKRAGASFSDIKEGLTHIGVEISDDRLLDLLDRLEKITIDGRSVPVFVKVYDKWYSNCI